MKILSLILSLLILLSALSGCTAPSEAPAASETEEGTETVFITKTEEETDPSKIPEANRLSKEKIASFPIANSSMSEEELRKLCVDFFRFSQTFAWTPDRDWKYGSDAENPNKTLTAGTVYGGFPYLLGTGNVYRIAEFYDEETGVVHMDGAAARQRLFGNFCSYGSGWGFSRVVNSAVHKLTKDMVPKNGYVPVGSYEIDPNLEELEKNTTVDICKNNGKDVMISSYALLKPADALVTFSSGGHVIMCSEVKVVKKADGTVDPDQSYIKYLDQKGTWSYRKLENGKNYQVQGGVDQTCTFSQLFKKNYIPYTFGEFLGTDPVEKGEAELICEAETPTVSQLSAGFVRANYMISDVFWEVLDTNGKTVQADVIRTTNGGVLSAKLTSFGETFSAEYASPAYTLRIRCQIGNGELLPVWEGKLLAN